MPSLASNTACQLNFSEANSVLTINSGHREVISKILPEWQNNPHNEHKFDALLVELPPLLRNILLQSTEELQNWFQVSQKGGLLIRAASIDKAVELFEKEFPKGLKVDLKVGMTEIIRHNLEMLDESLGDKNTYLVQLRFEEPHRNFLRWHLDLRNRVVTIVTPLFGPGTHFAPKEIVDRESFMRYRIEFHTQLIQKKPSSELAWAKQILYDRNAPFLLDHNKVIQSSIGQSSIIRDGFEGSAHRGPDFGEFFSGLPSDLNEQSLANIFKESQPSIAGRILLLTSIAQYDQVKESCRWQNKFSSLKEVK